MSVNAIVQNFGSWSLKLAENTPASVIDALGYFGHVAVIPGRLNVAAYQDNLLRDARYVGVLRSKEVDADGVTTISGASMLLWLGDDQDKGDIYQVPTSFHTQSFADVITGLLPAAVTPGDIHAVAGTYTGTHYLESPRAAIGYVCGLFGAQYRVNGDGTLDAGLASDLYNTTAPTCIVVRKGAGKDMSVEAIEGKLDLQTDVIDYTTRVVLVASGQGPQTPVGYADNPTGNLYKDIHGNYVKLVRAVAQPSTISSNADTAASVVLEQFQDTRAAIQLSSSDYDVEGAFNIGDSVWVYDPESGLVDVNNEVQFRGRVLNPVLISALGVTFPVTDGYTVAFRDQNGTWYDLTNYFVKESGDTTITVGALPRTLVSSSGVSPVSQIVGPDGPTNSDVPDVPTGLSATTNEYVDAVGSQVSRIVLSWTPPLNTDGSVIKDGDHYTVRYYRSDDATNTYTYVSTPWDATVVVIGELPPGITYELSVAAFDTANQSAGFSADYEVEAAVDTLAPSTPAPPTVAGNTLSIQVTSTLGKASGGTYNMDSDLDHFEVHVGTTASFTPDNSTLAGILKADNGMILQSVAAVASYPIPDSTPRYVKLIAVDQAGNKSLPSVAATVTATLITSTNITDATITDAKIGSVSAGKITAGTLSANIVLGAAIQTAATGARVVLDTTGLKVFNAAGSNIIKLPSDGSTATFQGNIASGSVITSPVISGGVIVGTTIETASSGSRVVLSAGNFNQVQLFSVSNNEAQPAALFLDSGSTYNSLDVKSAQYGSNKIAGLFLEADVSGGGGASATLDAPASVTISSTNTSSSYVLIEAGVAQFYFKLADPTTNQNPFIQGGGNAAIKFAVRTGTPEVQARGANDAAYGQFTASNFLNTSSSVFKTSIKDASQEMLPHVLTTKMKTYQKQTGVNEDGSMAYGDRLHYGPLLEEMPEHLVVDGEVYDVTATIWTLWKAVQELAAKVDELTQQH